MKLAPSSDFAALAVPVHDLQAVQYAFFGVGDVCRFKSGSA